MLGYSILWIPIYIRTPFPASMATTTVQLTRELKKVLDAMKLHRRESYNDVLERLVEDLQELNAETKRELERAVKEIEAGKVRHHKQVEAEVGLLRRSWS